MKRIKVVLLDPETREPVDHWFSTPTAYILELMAELGVDFNVAATIDVDKIATITDADMLDLGPEDKATVQELRDRVAKMSEPELEAERVKRAESKLKGLRLTNAMLAAFLTMNEREGNDGMPVKIWSRKQAADIIPFSRYHDVEIALGELVDDAKTEADSGNVEEQAAATN